MNIRSKLNISREDYPHFRQRMVNLANYFAIRTDAESARRLGNCLDVLDGYCSYCGNPLRRKRARRCRLCWTVQPWVSN